MATMMKALECMEARLQAVERAPSNHTKRHREDRDQIPQVGGMENEVIEYNANDDDAIIGMGVPRGGGRGG